MYPYVRIKRVLNTAPYSMNATAFDMQTVRTETDSLISVDISIFSARNCPGKSSTIVTFHDTLPMGEVWRFFFSFHICLSCSRRCIFARRSLKDLRFFGVRNFVRSQCQPKNTTFTTSSTRSFSSWPHLKPCRVRYRASPESTSPGCGIL